MLQLWPPEMPVAFTAFDLHFREWQPDDAACMVRLFDTEQMNRWTPLPSPFTSEVALDYVARAHAARDSDGTLQLAVLPTAAGDPVAELIVFPGSEPGCVELAYAVGAEHQNKGIARRSVRAAVDLARRAAARRVLLTIAEGNETSAAVATATGFVPTAAPAVERRRKGFVLQMTTWTLEL